MAKVRDVMTADPMTITGEASITEAGRLCATGISGC
jgi:hypothetical protein